MTVRREMLEEAANLVDGDRTCNKCSATKPVSMFEGNRITCKRCRNQRTSEWRRRKRAQDPLGWSKRDREEHLRRNLGISPEIFDEILLAQGGCCAICGADTPGKYNWAVDHDHSCCPDIARSCGRCVRGLLCARCNNGLGCFRDSPELLDLAIQYLTTKGVRLEPAI